METIKALLATKNQTIIHRVEPTESVFEAVTLMVKMNIGAVLVMKDDTLMGIITERDYLRFVTDGGRTSRNTPVSELMTKRVIFVVPDTPLDDVMTIITQNRIRHVPVMTDGTVLGIVSIGDVVKQIATNRQVTIDNLEEYIADNYPGPQQKTTEA